MADANAATMAIVAEIFAAFPGRFRLTSRARTAVQDADSGDVSNSYHLAGQAVDFVSIDGHYPPREKEAIGRIVARHGYEVIFYNAGRSLHYHIEPAPRGMISAASTTALSLTRQSSISPAVLILGFLFVVLLSMGGSKSQAYSNCAPFVPPLN